MLKRGSLLILLLPFLLQGQQNQQLFHMHYLGQSNFLNPAVQSSCKWFIGIPVLSSVHLNVANSAFSYSQLIENMNQNQSESNIDRIVNQLGRRSIFSSEIHLSLLAMGYKHDDFYFNLSITEKNNLTFTLPRDFINLIWKGNTQFLGEEASSKGTGLYANHYREFAIGISKNTGYRSYLGVKAKLLFGKYNASMSKFDISLFTNPITFDLGLSGKLNSNISIPYLSFDSFESFAFASNIDVKKIILNRKNWGFAFDAGFIKSINSRLSLSGSILDIGFIRWKTDPHNFQFSGDYTYQGELADSANIFQNIAESTIEISHSPYFSALPTKMYFGAEYTLTPRVKAQGLGSAVIYPTKLVTALTVATDVNPFGNFHLVASYSLMYRSYNNIGLGFSAGRGPLQFYVISDNVVGLIKPLNTRNLNLRFGLNINLGCQEKTEQEEMRQSTLDAECKVFDKTNKKPKRHRKRP